MDEAKKAKKGGKTFFSNFLNRKEDGKYVLAFIFILALLTGIVFFQVRNFDFVGVDDNRYVVKNEHVNTGLNFENVKWAFNVGYASNWHPLAWLSHMLDVELFGLNSGGHHYTSLFFHFLSSFLLFFLLYKTTKKFWQSAFVSIFFAIHPLRAESVAFVAERKDILSVFFGLLAMLSYFYYTKTKSQNYYLATVLLFAFSLLSKPMLVTLPIIFILLDFWPLKRIADFDFKKHKKKLKQLVSEKIPFFLMSIGVSILTVMAQKNALISPETVSISKRIENALISYLIYIKKLFWPVDLAFPYPSAWANSSSGSLKFTLAFLAVAVITGLVILFAKKRRFLPFGWFWYLISLFPVIGIVQVGSQSMADRFTYFPQIGLLVIIVWGAASLARHFYILPKYLIAAGMLAVLLLVPIARKQVGYWKDVVTLFSHSVSITKSNSMAYDALCVHHTINGELEKGIKNCNEAIKIWNKDPYSLENKFNIFFLAKERFIDSDDEEIKNADFIDAVGKMHEKGHDFSQEPENFNNFINVAAQEEYSLGIRFIELKKMDRAEEALRNAIKLNPRYVEALTDLGVLKIGQEKLDESIEYFSRAIEINPEYISALYHWGVALRLSGNNEEAKEKIEKVLSIKPGFPPAVSEYKKLDLAEDRKGIEGNKESAGEENNTKETEEKDFD